MAVMARQTIEPLARFIAAVRRARAEQYLNLPLNAVQDENAFAEMRAYLMRYYDGITPAGGFVDAGGSIFDCIPIEQQLSLRGRSVSVAAPSDPPGSDRNAHAAPTGRVGTETCPQGTIPIRRLTLEELCRFPTLADFFRKAPTLEKAARRR
jgi:hypothetical protein